MDRHYNYFVDYPPTPPLNLPLWALIQYNWLYHSSCPNHTVAECDKFEENNLSHCKNISWFSMFLFHEFFMVLCWYWVKLLQITNKLDSYCGIKSISHVDSCDKWTLHLSHSSIVRYTLKLLDWWKKSFLPKIFEQIGPKIFLQILHKFT